MTPGAAGAIAFVVFALLGFAWARVRYWKRAFLAEVATNQRILDTRTAQRLKTEDTRAIVDGMGQSKASRR